MAGRVVEGVATGEDINRVLEKLQPVFDEENGVTIQAAFITCLLQNAGPDDITQDELIQGVHDISSYILIYSLALRVPKGQIAPGGSKVKES